ncbi:MAG: hypothetical protein QME14_04055 [Methanobacteriaceae archaeon]|nr:hypothetical protein [Methanobacteriaceae archaeon]
MILISGCTVSTNETEYKTSAQEVTFQQLIENPDNYRDQDIAFTGKVLNNMGSLDDTIYLGDPDSNSTDQGIIVSDIPLNFEGDQENLKKGDTIKVYGKISGRSTVTISTTSTTPGESFSYSGPAINIAAMYIEVVSS